MTSLRTSFPSVRRSVQRAFTLIEVMVSIALGVLIILALGTLLINVNANRSEMARTGSVIENARFAMQLLEADLSHTGFWGSWMPNFDDLSQTSSSYSSGAGTIDYPSAVPDPCKPYSVANWTTTYQRQLLGIALQVYEVDSSGVAQITDTNTCATSMFANAQPYTHILFVRHAAPCAAAPTTLSTATPTDEDCKAEASAVYFQPSRCSSATAPGYTFAAAADLNLSNFTQQNRGCAAASAPDRRTSDQASYSTALAPAYKYVAHMYYVRNYSVTSGDGIPTLMRAKFRLVGGVAKWDTPESLIEGIEGFRVELGIDDKNRDGTALSASSFDTAPTWATTTSYNNPTNRGDGAPDSFKQCTTASTCSAFQLMNTVAVKLYMLVRATSRTPGYTDGKTYTLGDTSAGGVCYGATSGCIALTGNTNFKRHLYMQALRLNNISMRRELSAI